MKPLSIKEQSRCVLIFMFICVIASAVVLGTRTPEGTAKKILVEYGYQDPVIQGEARGCLNGTGYHFSATGKEGTADIGVLCQFKDHNSVTVVHSRQINQ